MFRLMPTKRPKTLPCLFNIHLGIADHDRLCVNCDVLYVVPLDWAKSRFILLDDVINNYWASARAAVLIRTKAFYI
jgi:hypothetical protein